MIPLLDADFVTLAAIAEADAGLYMPPTKRAFVASRLQRRLRHTGLSDFHAYIKLVGSSGTDGEAERQAFVGALTTNVTQVFREPHHFELLAAHLQNHFEYHGGGRYRIWSAGCSSGEEPLSIAAICHAVLGRGWKRSVDILATDVDRTVLDLAQAREEEPDLLQALKDLPVAVSRMVEKLPTRHDPTIKDLQGGITYRFHNLIHALNGEASFDVIFCRNVTIYFNRKAQETVHERLRARLAPSGLLAIGHSEQLLGRDVLMEAAGRTAFRRVPDSDRMRSNNKGEA